MSFNRLVTLFAILAVFTMAIRFSIGADTYWHLRAGEWMLENGEILRTDPFSLTRMGEGWTYPGWLAQIGLTAIHRALGFPGLNLMVAALVTAAFAFVWRSLTGPMLLRAFVLLLAATASGVYWSARPHILSFALTAAALWALARTRREGGRWIWLLPALTLLWVNVHGAFFLPLLLLALEAAARAYEMVRLRIAKGGGDSVREGEGGTIPLRTIALVAAACVLAIAINPHGLSMLPYPIQTISIGVLRTYIQEWQSPDFHLNEVQPFLWLFGLTVLSMAVSRARPRVIEIVHVTVFGYLSFLAARNIALFTLAAAPVLARHLASIIQDLPIRGGSRKDLSQRYARPLNLVLFSLLTIAAGVKALEPLSLEFNQRMIEESMPAEAARHILEADLEGPLFNTYNWGGFVLWELYPRHLSFVDGRTDLFDDEVLEQYLGIWRADSGWERSFQHWGIRLALVERDSPIARALSSAGWETNYRDEKSVVLVDG